MAVLDPVSPESDALVRRHRTLRRWVWLFLGLALVGCVLLLPAAVQFPAASVPATLGAAFGYYRARRRGLRLWTMAQNRDHITPMLKLTLFWGTLAGVVGYAALAAWRIGVPDPATPLGWRLVHAVIFGAGAGTMAAGLLPLLLELPLVFRSLKRAA